MTRPQKRSFTIKGHRTSISLEAAFWDALREAAAAQGPALAHWRSAPDLVALEPEAQAGEEVRDWRRLMGLTARRAWAERAPMDRSQAPFDAPPHALHARHRPCAIARADRRRAPSYVWP